MSLQLGREKESLSQKRIKRRLGKQQVEGKDFRLLDEVRYIQQRAAVHDGRIITLGQLILFSTETGDAWLLDTEDRLATRIAQDGVSLPIHIEDIDTSFSVEWKGGYRVRHRLHLCRQGHRKSSKHSWLPNRSSFLIHMSQKFQICLARVRSLTSRAGEEFWDRRGSRSVAARMERTADAALNC